MEQCRGLARELEPRIRPDRYRHVGGAWKALPGRNNSGILQPDFQLLYKENQNINSYVEMKHVKTLTLFDQIEA